MIHEYLLLSALNWTQQIWNQFISMIRSIYVIYTPTKDCKVSARNINIMKASDLILYDRISSSWFRASLQINPFEKNACQKTPKNLHLSYYNNRHHDTTYMKSRQQICNYILFSSKSQAYRANLQRQFSLMQPQLADSFT